MGSEVEDVRWLLENQPPAALAKELVRVRALADMRGAALMRIGLAVGTMPGTTDDGLADEVFDAVDALRKDLAETRKDREEARAGAKGVWEDLTKARVEVIRLRAEVERLRAEKSRAYLLGAAIDDANRVLDRAGVAKENDAGQTLTLWDRVELLVDERDGARRAGATPSPFVFRREVGDNVVEIRAPTLPDLEAAIAAVTKATGS